jgi:O-antigen/teichoic acid export membrane protein
VTPDSALDSLDKPDNQISSTAGMTTKVVKGSIWTLAGQIAPFAVSFIATPFVIRFLGSEAYGVLLLVGLIPMYFNFADFGMAVATTKFASEAFGEGDRKKEGQIVWTAATIAAISSSIVAIPIFIFSEPIVRAFNVPEGLLFEANLALRISAVAFVIGILGAVLNSPMLARLRMDVAAMASTLPRVALAIATPIILLLGGGIIGAVVGSFVFALIGFVIVCVAAIRFLPELLVPSPRRQLVRPLLSFGAGWFVAMVAALLLVNLEKLLLARMVSVEALAFYSVAFTFANLASMFSSAMTQSLFPAFTQLMAPGKRGEFDALFGRAIRLNAIWAAPGVLFLGLIAEPFFTIWAGETFGRESTLPFYILLFGLFFNILAYIPHAAITSAGRTDVFARVYWIELAVYIPLAFGLIHWFGIVGSAAAWSIRVVLDAFIIAYFAKRIAKVKFGMGRHLTSLLIGAGLLVIPLVLLFLFGNYSIPLLVSIPLIGVLYGLLVWRKLIEDDEKAWARQRLANLVG